MDKHNCGIRLRRETSTLQRNLIFKKIEFSANQYRQLAIFFGDGQLFRTCDKRIQHSIMEKVTAPREMISKLQFEAEKKSKQAKADVEAMILGTKPVPEGIPADLEIIKPLQVSDIQAPYGGANGKMTQRDLFD